MPSPYPGMDPYLERPRSWPDVHNSLAADIRRQLNQTLPDGFFAESELREDIGLSLRDPGEDILGGPSPDVSRTSKKTEPDVGVVGDPTQPQTEGGVATLAPPETRVAESPYEIIDPIELASVHVYAVDSPDDLLTAIEIVSPSNKRPGSDRDRHRAKIAAFFAAGIGVVELDLLRTGERTLPVCSGDPYAVWASVPLPEGRRELRAYCCRLTQPLPVVAVPLGAGRAPHTLDVQAAFTAMYDGGKYGRGAIDYTQPPVPPLDEPLAPDQPALPS